MTHDVGQHHRGGKRATGMTSAVTRSPGYAHLSEAHLKESQGVEEIKADRGGGGKNTRDK